MPTTHSQIFHLVPVCDASCLSAPWGMLEQSLFWLQLGNSDKLTILARAQSNSTSTQVGRDPISPHQKNFKGTSNPTQRHIRQ